MKKFLLSIAACMWLTVADAAKPNVVMVVVNGMGYTHMGCAGNNKITTPNIDRLYAQSSHLTDFHCEPDFSPTLASILTGRYSGLTGVWDDHHGFNIMDDQAITLAQILLDNGYRTAIFGTWALGEGYAYGPLARGFEHSLVHGGSEVGSSSDYWGNDGFQDKYLLNGEWTQSEGYATGAWFGAAAQFIREHKDEPFFCLISPSTSTIAEQEYSQPYRDAGMDDATARLYGSITYIDYCLGQLRAMINQLGREDNTIIIFTCANPMSGGDKSIGPAYEPAHHVPCMVYHREGQLDAGRDIGQLSGHIDLLPTITEICQLPNTYYLPLDGMRLKGALRGVVNTVPNKAPERTLFAQYNNSSTPSKLNDYCMMQGHWRMVNGSELYDSATDPGQIKNLAGDDRFHTGLMKAQCDAWWQYVLERASRYCEIYIGDPQQPITTLDCGQWYPDISTGNRTQNVIRQRDHGTGFWQVDVVRTGTYRLRLRMMPVQEDCPMDATSIVIIVDGERWEQKCSRDDVEAIIEVPLRAGSHRLQTWVMGNQGKAYGVPYVYAQFLE